MVAHKHTERALGGHFIMSHLPKGHLGITFSNMGALGGCWMQFFPHKTWAKLPLEVLEKSSSSILTFVCAFCLCLSSFLSHVTAPMQISRLILNWREEKCIVLPRSSAQAYASLCLCTSQTKRGSTQKNPAPPHWVDKSSTGYLYNIAHDLLKECVFHCLCGMTFLPHFLFLCSASINICYVGLHY